VNKPRELEIHVFANALTIKTGEQCRGRSSIKTFSVEKNPDFHSAPLPLLPEQQQSEATRNAIIGRFCQANRCVCLAGRHAFIFKSFVNGKLVLRFLQFDGNVHFGLAHVIVFAKRPVTAGNHLDPDLTKRDSGCIGLPVLMGLQFQTFLPDSALFVQKVDYNFRILHRFTSRFPNHHHVQHGCGVRRRISGLLGRGSQQEQRENHQYTLGESHSPLL
jgi:hypothetical protein